MISKSHIIERTDVVPWQELRQIEQDLIITRALIEIYSHPELKEKLAFRGGTALNKLIFRPASRYSEDIDFVQIPREKIGPTISMIRSIMDPWLGEPKRDFSHGLVTLSYRVISDEGIPLKLKIEINTREHEAFADFEDYVFTSTSSCICRL